MEDKCIICGETIPEGRQICWICEHNTMEEKDDTRIFERTENEVPTEE